MQIFSAHSKANESTKKSSIKEKTAPITSSSESAASPKPAADQATKRNVLLLQTKSNSQRNITIPQVNKIFMAKYNQYFLRVYGRYFKIAKKLA